MEKKKAAVVDDLNVWYVMLAPTRSFNWFLAPSTGFFENVRDRYSQSQPVFTLPM